MLNAVAWMARDERGVALPMALFTLLLLTSLSLAFLTLGQTEPTIAGNHRRVAQARALAEAGLEKAIWAMTNSTDPNGIANTSLAAPGSPYNGSLFVAISNQGGYTGGFTLLITNNTNSFNVREVTAVGYSPDVSATSKAKSTVISKIVKVNPIQNAAPCGLCVNGQMDVTGNVTADSNQYYTTGNTSCGPKYGAYSSSTIDASLGNPHLIASASASENVNNTDYKQNSSFNFTFSRTPAGSSDIDALRALAKTKGTYIKPGSTTEFDLTAVPNGIVFVDTTDGTNTATAGNKATVNIGPGWSASTPFTGWVIVLGDMDIDGNFGGVSGIVYTQGMMTTQGFGANEIRGLTIVENVMGAASFAPGNSRFYFDCNAATAPLFIPTGWFGQAGTYCDKPGGC